MGFRDGDDSGEGGRAGVKGTGRGGGEERGNPGRDGGYEGMVERGKNRDAPDWHEGLRLLACASATWRGSARH